ncbi:MAG: hypothetical protein NZ914_06735 [Gemmatales bacterium]|nr:hypothetical protein [Gemmatales bacterium]
MPIARSSAKFFDAHRAAWIIWLSQAALFLLGGLDGVANVSAQDAANEAEFARQLPAQAKQHVYIFFLNGLDPFEFAQLSALRDYCRDLGFQRCWFGQFYHRWYFQQVIEEIWQEDAEARLVLVGFSAGAIAARDLAHALKRANIPVDLLMYIGGAILTNSPRSRPENVRRLIHIRANELVFRGWAIEGADNVKCEDVWHFGAPTHPETRRRLAEALAEIAGQVPVPQPAPTVWPGSATDLASGTSTTVTDITAVETVSSVRKPEPDNPTRTVLRVPTANSPWDFLRATRQLRQVPPPDYSGLPYQRLP